MAMISCYECGVKISSTASVCPYCGYKKESFAKEWDRRRRLEKANQEYAREKVNQMVEDMKIAEKKEMRLTLYLLLFGFVLYLYGIYDGAWTWKLEFSNKTTNDTGDISF